MSTMNLTTKSTVQIYAEMTPTQVIKQESGDYLISNPISLSDLCALTAQLLEAKFRRSLKITSSEQTKQYLQSKLAMKEQEVFCILFLDNQHGLIAFEELFTGTIDAASVYPREVIKRCLHHNAAAVILTHNHPSGVPEPSASDRTITKRLQDALSLIDVRVLDHIVVGGNGTVSFSERGIL